MQITPLSRRKFALQLILRYRDSSNLPESTDGTQNNSVYLCFSQKEYDYNSWEPSIDSSFYFVFRFIIYYIYLPV